MTHDPDLVIKVATDLSVLLFGRDYRFETEAAQEIARSYARKLLDRIVPLVREGAAS